MSTWRRILSWDTVPEPVRAPGQRVLGQEAAEYKRRHAIGDASIHQYEVHWTGYSNGTSFVYAPDLTRGLELAEFGYDENFNAGDGPEWNIYRVYDPETEDEEQA